MKTISRLKSRIKEPFSSFSCISERKKSNYKITFSDCQCSQSEVTKKEQSKLFFFVIISNIIFRFMHFIQRTAALPDDKTAIEFEFQDRFVTAIDSVSQEHNRQANHFGLGEGNG